MAEQTSDMMHEYKVYSCLVKYYIKNQCLPDLESKQKADLFFETCGLGHCDVVENEAFGRSFKNACQEITSLLSGEDQVGSQLERNAMQSRGGIKRHSSRRVTRSSAALKENPREDRLTAALEANVQLRSDVSKLLALLDTVNKRCSTGIGAPSEDRVNDGSKCDHARTRAKATKQHKPSPPPYFPLKEGFCLIPNSMWHMAPQRHTYMQYWCAQKWLERQKAVNSKTGDAVTFAADSDVALSRERRLFSSPSSDPRPTKKPKIYDDCKCVRSTRVTEPMPHKIPSSLEDISSHDWDRLLDALGS